MIDRPAEQPPFLDGPCQRGAQGVSRRRFLIGLGTTSALMVAPRWALAAQHREVQIDAPTDGRDATDIIMRQIAAAPDGSVIRFPVGRSSGRYRVDGRLWIQERRGLTIVGPTSTDPATIWSDRVGQEVGIVNHRGYSARNHWSFRKCDNIRLQNLRVEGPNKIRDPQGYSKITTIYEGEHAFSFNMSSGCQLVDCSADSVYGDGCWLHGPAGFKTTAVTIKRFTTTSNGRHGLGIFNVDGVLVDGLTVVKGGTVGVDMEPNGPGESTLNVELLNCRIDTRTVAFSAFGAREVSNVWLHDNSVTYAKTWPVLGVKRRDGGRSRNWLVENNVAEFESLAARGLNFVRVDDVTVRGNRIGLASRGERVGVTLRDCLGRLEVIDNDFTGASAAFAPEGSTGEVVSTGNRCRGCRPQESSPQPPREPPKPAKPGRDTASADGTGTTTVTNGDSAVETPSADQAPQPTPARRVSAPARDDPMAEATAGALTAASLTASATAVAVRNRRRAQRTEEPPGGDALENP